MTKSCKSVLLKRMIHMEQEIKLEKHRNDGVYRAVCVRANLKAWLLNISFKPDKSSLSKILT